MLKKYPFEVAAIMEGNPAHTDEQKMICNLYAHICGAVAAHAKGPSGFYAGIKFEADHPQDYKVVDLDPTVYLLALLYASQLENPCEQIKFGGFADCVNSFPSKFPTSPNAENTITLLLEMAGWVNYLKEPVKPARMAVPIPNENKWSDQKLADKIAQKRIGGTGGKLGVTISAVEFEVGSHPTVLFEVVGVMKREGFAMYCNKQSYVMDQEGIWRTLPRTDGCKTGSLSGEIKARALRAIAESEAP